jgi:hypothetical protein
MHQAVWSGRPGDFGEDETPGGEETGLGLSWIT